MLRKTCPRHFVTTNNVGLVDTINMHDLYELDFTAFDNYSTDMLMSKAGWDLPPSFLPPSPSDDFARSVKGGKPFMIMEEQSGKAGQKTFSPQPEKGQVRLWTYQAIAHGAMGVNYFRWDTATFGAEEYWHGVLNHDRSKSPGYDEIKQGVKELKALGREALYSNYVAGAALVFDWIAAGRSRFNPGTSGWLIWTRSRPGTVPFRPAAPESM